MNYLKIYNQLIDKWRGFKFTEDIYIEKHHIIPRCLGGNDTDENIISLPPREHLVAHELLAMIYPNDININFSVIAMSMNSKFTLGRNTTKVSSRLFAYFRERSSSLQKGKYIKKDSREKMSKIKLGKSSKKPSNFGKHVSEGKKNKPYGTRVLDTRTGKIYSTLQECGKDFGYSASTIKYWINKIPERGLILYTGEGHLVEHHGNRKMAKPVIGPDGTRYKSLKDCARKTKHELRTLKRWIETNPEKGFKYDI